MTGDVLKFPKAEPQYWVCSCSCSTFHLRDDGETICAACDELAGNGGWNASAFSDAGDIDVPKTNKLSVADEELIRHRFSKAVLEDEFAFIALVYDSGRTRTLGRTVETRAERGWLNRRLADIKDALT